MLPRRTRSCASRPRHAQPTRSRCDHSPSSSLPPPPALPPAAPPSPAALRPAPLRGGGASAAAWTRTNHAAAAVLDWSCARPQPARPAEPPAGQRMTPHIHMHIHTHMHAHSRTHTHRCPSLGQEGEGRWQEGQARVVGQLRGRELLRVRSASLPAGAAAASTPPAAYQASPKLQGAAPSTMPRAPPRIPAHGSRLDFPRSIYCPAEGEFDSDDNFVKKQPPTKKAPVARKPLAAAAARPVASSQPASMATTSSLHTAAGADKKAPAARKREPVGGYGARGRASRLLPAPSAAPSAELSCRWPPLPRTAAAAKPTASAATASTAAPKAPAPKPAPPMPPPGEPVRGGALCPGKHTPLPSANGPALTSSRAGRVLRRIQPAFAAETCFLHFPSFCFAEEEMSLMARMAARMGGLTVAAPAGAARPGRAAGAAASKKASAALAMEDRCVRSAARVAGRAAGAGCAARRWAPRVPQCRRLPAASWRV
jgi:hypothetical protein